MSMLYLDIWRFTQHLWSTWKTHGQGRKTGQHRHSKHKGWTEIQWEVLATVPAEVFWHSFPSKLRSTVILTLHHVPLLDSKITKCRVTDTQQDDYYDRSHDRRPPETVAMGESVGPESNLTQKGLSRWGHVGNPAIGHNPFGTILD